MYPYFLLAAFLQGVSLAPQVPLLEDCSVAGRVVASLRPTDNVQVRSSRAGESQTCYAVTARIDGRDTAGYVLGQALPAIVEFESQRKEAAKPDPPPATAPAPAPAAASRLRTFRNFSGLDVIKNQPFELSSLDGNIILVCFWSPRFPESERELIAVSRLVSQLGGRGLQAVGVSLDIQRLELLDSLDDSGARFPNVPDTNGLADREGVSVQALPYTFILNRRHEIVASGLHGAALETTVQNLLREQ